MTDVEQWLLARVGLSKWLAPHLCICLDVVKNGVERIAESELGDIFLGDEGIVLLGDNHPVAKELNSSFLCFLKSLVLLSSFIDQSRLVFGGDAYQRKETLPQPMMNALANAFEKIDPGHSQVWMRLAELQ